MLIDVFAVSPTKMAIVPLEKSCISVSSERKGWIMNVRKIRQAEFVKDRKGTSHEQYHDIDISIS